MPEASKALSDRGPQGADAPRSKPVARHPSSEVPRTSAALSFSELDIAAIVRRDEHGQQLIRELQRTRAVVRPIWPIPEQIPVDHDLVFCEACPDLAKRLPWLPGSPGAALVLVLPAGRPLDLEVLHCSAPHAVLHLPATADAVLSALVVARSHFLYEQRLRGRIEKLDDNLRTMRCVERAKAILIETKQLSEQDAYHFMRRTAMERRVSIGTLAAMIVDSHELLG
ncbi:MAG: ANTAR domain-containing response regulator [Kiloniellales bacterium]